MLTLQEVFIKLNNIQIVFMKPGNRKGWSEKVGHHTKDSGGAAEKEIRAEIRGKEEHLLLRFMRLWTTVDMCAQAIYLHELGNGLSVTV